MRVRLLDLAQMRAATDDVLSSQRFILGPKLTEFEKAAADYCGAARENLALPIYPEIPREALQYVVNCIAEFFG